MKKHFRVQAVREEAKRVIAKRIEELRSEMQKALAAGDTRKWGTLQVELVSFGGMD